jgi:hypothetical protein
MALWDVRTHSMISIQIPHNVTYPKTIITTLQHSKYSEPPFEPYKPKTLYHDPPNILQKTVTHYSNNMLNTVCCMRYTGIRERCCWITSNTQVMVLTDKQTAASFLSSCPDCLGSGKQKFYSISSYIANATGIRHFSLLSCDSISK